MTRAEAGVGGYVIGGWSSVPELWPAEWCVLDSDEDFAGRGELAAFSLGVGVPFAAPSLSC